jgi:hypothetical protein
VTGEESFILKVKTANTESLERLLGGIRSLDGVTGTVTKVVLSSAKESQKMEFDPAFLDGLRKGERKSDGSLRQEKAGLSRNNRGM